MSNEEAARISARTRDSRSGAQYGTVRRTNLHRPKRIGERKSRQDVVEQNKAVCRDGQVLQWGPNGLARVSISPDRSECAPDLYEAEARARARHAGIWAKEHYRVRSPEKLKDTIGTFQLVEGLVSNIGRADGRTFIDFSDPTDNRRVFTAVIGSESRRAFRDFEFDELSGHRVRLRGVVQDYRGRPEIVLSNPFQIEVLD